MINSPRRQLRAIIPILAVLSFLNATGNPLHAQTPSLSRTIIVLDPAHGGADAGAHISDNLAEKEVTLAFAARLRPLLAAAGFTVVATRDADPVATAPPFTPDIRAGIANHPHALACILIHATPSGSGVHLFTSTLSPNADTPDPTQPIPWDSAQGPYISLSLRLARQLGTALLHANIPPLLGRASIRPLDNLTCPAVAIEIAPLVLPDANPTLISDATYQQHIAQAIVAALTAWRNEAAPVSPAAQPAPRPAPASPPPAAPPAAKPAPPTGATP